MEGFGSRRAAGIRFLEIVGARLVTLVQVIYLPI